jgi:hypothetical protein
LGGLFAKVILKKAHPPSPMVVSLFFSSIVLFFNLPLLSKSKKLFHCSKKF